MTRLSQTGAGEAGTTPGGDADRHASPAPTFSWSYPGGHMKPRLTIIGIILTCAVLIGAGKCNTSPCDLERAQSAATCAAQGVNSPACQDALAAATKACTPSPTTTTTTTVPPTTTTTTTAPPANPPESPEGCTPREEDLVAWEIQRPSRLLALMAEVRTEVGDRRGNLDFAGTRLLVAQALWKRSVCAIVGQDAVFIEADDGLWEEWHVAAETDGGWGTNAYLGVHHVRADARPTSAGVEPLPDRRALWVRGHRVNAWFDFTPEIKPKDGSEPEAVHQLCVAYGFGTWPDGTPRYNCPLGADLTPVRIERERWAMGGGSICLSSPTNVPVFHNPENWLQCSCGSGCAAVRICSVDLSLCSDWVPVERPTLADGSSQS